MAAGFMRVPCGRCIACRLNYASMMAQRMMHETKFHDESTFLTLTYNDESLPWSAVPGWRSQRPSLFMRDCQLFFKRLRKKVSVRYFLVGEYGDQNRRPHYHAIVFGLGPRHVKVFQDAWSVDGKSLGYVDCRDVEFGSCAYVAKYVTKKTNLYLAEYYRVNGLEPERSLMSRRPGIGGKYVEKFGTEIFNRGFMLINGRKAAIPKYYISKIYASDERKARRQEDLDKLQKEKYLLDREKGAILITEEEKLRCEGTQNLLVAQQKLAGRTL